MGIFKTAFETARLMHRTHKQHPDDRLFRRMAVDLALLHIAHPIKAVKTWKWFSTWKREYLHAWVENAGKQHYSVDRDVDRKIVHEPVYGFYYLKMYADIVSFTRRLAHKLSTEEFERAISVFMRATEIAGRIFRECPTTTSLGAKPYDHAPLRLIQLLDTPVNCCPSLHIAYLSLMENFSRMYGLPQLPGNE
ncbi:MAG: hypothetical protein WCT31_05855, partial [Candidatus Micrarchaeia archaeon]